MNADGNWGARVQWFDPDSLRDEEMIETLNPSETLDRDLYCMGCGYNLRGQHRDGNCSECGEMVRSAFFPGRVMLGGQRSKNIAWWATLFLLISVSLTLTSVLTLFAGAAIEELALVLFVLWVGTEHVLWLLGAVFLARLAEHGRYAKLRSPPLLVATGLNFLCMGVFLMMVTVTVILRESDYMVVGIFVFTGLVFATRCPAVFFMQRWLSTLCCDIGRPDLMRHIRRTGYAIASVIVGMVSAYITAWIMGSLDQRFSEMIAMGCLWVIGIGYLALAVLCIIAIVHLSRLLHALRKLVISPVARVTAAAIQTPASAIPS
ncbi:MAG: hypothetical protein GC164_06925 [Phycisphaera sp.]|nr:hypothetical protein [Phycisphaera sp.]